MNIESCPFCLPETGKPVIFESETHRYIAVHCKDCNAYGPDALTVLGAIKKWNSWRENLLQHAEKLGNIVRTL